MREAIITPMGPVFEGIFENTDKSKELDSALEDVNSLADTVTDEQVFRGALDRLWQAFIESRRARQELGNKIDESAQFISATGIAE